jgi:ubiquinone/menaquinone biosynthesis C-methylase UbiE
MDENTVELLERIRQQFEFNPYPQVAIDSSPKDDLLKLYTHNLVTPYYLRNQQVIKPEEQVILDVGCGSGWTTLILAEANPEAKIIGIDISAHSLDLARARLQYHGFGNVDFHLLSLDELPKQGWEFDYINCDELLYLFPEPSVALAAMKSVLKPQGIIRSNLHSSLQRFNCFRAQKIFQMMGLLDGNPEDMEIEMAVETLKALKDSVDLKTKVWFPRNEGEEQKQKVLMNYLFQGDKGYTIPELFAALRAADLEFISMVNWRQWELMDLFKDPDNLPVFLALGLPEISVEQRLHLFELLHPIHRLLDFWCGHPKCGQAFVPVAEWSSSDWHTAKIHLHPQLKTPAVKEALLRCIKQLNPFKISRHLPIVAQEVLLDSTIGACLLPLWEEAQSMQSLVERWQKLCPVHPVTLESTTELEAFDIVRETLMGLERSGYVLLELEEGVGSSD